MYLKTLSNTSFLNHIFGRYWQVELKIYNFKFGILLC
nr:MAG TPA: hypothetical protein [Caudoviricetes sp.]